MCFCICSWIFPAQSFSSLSPLGPQTISYCLRFKTSIFFIQQRFKMSQYLERIIVIQFNLILVYLHTNITAQSPITKLEKGKFLTLPDSNSNPSVVQPLASRYTEYAILAPGLDTLEKRKFLALVLVLMNSLCVDSFTSVVLWHPL